MAAYARATTLKAAEAEILLFRNTIDKKVLKDLMDLINTEFNAMVTAGLAGYTVTTGLLASMLQRLDNLNNDCSVQIMEDIIRLFVAECDAVETGGLAYTQTSGWLTTMKRTVQYYGDVLDRIMLHNVFTLYDTEFAAAETAS